MPIYKGSSKIKDIYYGNKVIDRVYKGSVLVYQRFVADFPREWGNFVRATCTVACNEAKTDWLYTWSLHFERGTLPVIVGKNATTVTPNLDLFAYDTNENLNSACYLRTSSKVWINAIASNESNAMVWRNTNDVAQDAISYPNAAAWGWNNGHRTVFTDDFSFEVVGKTLVIKKNGNNFKTFKIYV